MQNQILQAVLALKATTDDTKYLFNRLTDLVFSHDKILEDIERKLGQMHMGQQQERADLAHRLDEMQKTITKHEKDMNDLSGRLDARPAASTAASTTTAAASNEEIVILGGFSRNTPRVQIEAALRPLVKRVNDAEFGGVIKAALRAPHLLGSCGHLRLPKELAHQFVSHIRSKDYFITTAGTRGRLKVYLALQKPREIRERNRELLRLASIVQGRLKSGSDKQDNYKVVCWAGSSVVACARKVCSVSNMQVTIEENWWASDLWDKPQQTIEQELLEDHEGQTPRAPPPPTRTFSCWTHNMQHKADNSTGTIADIWDEAVVWDVVLLQ